MGVNGIYGLSGSGLDIESMVKVGMMGKQNEYDKMAQKYTKNEWTKAAYLELSSTINTFNMTKLSDYKYSSSMNAKTASSSDNTIKVTANASAAVMTHKVEATSLASNAYLVSEAAVTRKNTSAASDSIKLADAIFMGYDDYNTGTASVTYGNNDVNAKTNAFSNGQSAFKFTLSDGTNNVTINYSYDDLLGDNAKTFNDLVNEINNGGTNIRASYDSVNDRFSFYNSKGGAGDSNNIFFTLDQTTGNWSNNSGDDQTIAALNARDFLSKLNLRQSVNGELSEKAIEGSKKDNGVIEFVTSTSGEKSLKVYGQDGTVTIDGVGYTTKDNKITAGGITYDVTGASQGTSSVVNVSQDVEKIVDKVKSFVEDYNKLLSTLYEKYDEKPDSNYKPLTQSQKDGMKEEQITKWEEKAKQGLLYHDSTLQKIILDMRGAISNSVTLNDGSKMSAYNIGISTVAGNIKGQIRLDEDKLRAALSNDSEAVYKVFANLDSNDMDNTEKMGIAQRLGDAFTKKDVGALARIKARAGSSSDVVEDSDLNNLLRNLQTKMSNFKKMMNAFEDALYKKYDKMESTLARLGTQLNFIMGGNQ